MADENLADFYLVGGTALSLMLGHRISIDIDLFTGKDFDSAAVCEHLKAVYKTGNQDLLIERNSSSLNPAV